MRLLRYAWLLTMAFAGLAAAASVVGGAAPRARLVGVLEVECPMPCWQGIRPGATDVNTAVSLLSLSPFVDTRNMVIYNGPGTRDRWQVSWSDVSRQSAYVWGTLFAENNVVQRIDVNFSGAWPVSLNDLIGQLGMPPHVYGFESPVALGRSRADTVMLYYPEMGLEVTAYRRSWSMMSQNWLQLGRLSFVAVDPENRNAPTWELSEEEFDDPHRFLGP